MIALPYLFIIFFVVVAILFAVLAVKHFGQVDHEAPLPEPPTFDLRQLKGLHGTVVVTYDYGDSDESCEIVLFVDDAGAVYTLAVNYE